MSRSDYEPNEGFHIGETSPSFVSNVRRLLQAKSAKHYQHGHKTGKIAPSRLYRVGLPPIDSGDWNCKVFKKRTQETDLMDTCVTVLVDWSGSMHGEKCKHAAKATGLLNEAFAKVLRMPVEILSFSSRGSTPIMAVVKSYSRPATADQIAARFHKFLDHMNGNNDADSVLWAYDRILKRKEKRKLLIVMSDGSPSDGIGDPSYALKQVTSRIEAEGKVELYGIGIMDRNVERYYPKWHVIDYGQGIEQALISVLGKALT
jgi:cobalamin biosynthesis protein CobT